MEAALVSDEFPPRLMISKIVCENFKSYAGIKELGPFHKCFSSIVGPNGSGKSNVIDSMLFVFGYRAKKIRSKSVAVLIHNSEHHQNITSCSVSVHFQKVVDLAGDNYRIVPGSQFVVSRTAFKDNSSYYQLNGKKLPFKEIASLLRESGIDLDHNRFLILQGEVEQIALMKPKAQTEHDEGMLEFLEDIVGTSQYKEPIEELGKRVEELNETRGEKLNRVKAVEKEKNRLEGAKREAEEFLEMQKSVSIKHYQLYERYKSECAQLQSIATERKTEVEAKIDEVRESCKEATTELGTKTKQQRKLIKHHEKTLEIKEKAKSALKSCEQRDVRVRLDIKNSKSQLKKMTKTLEKEREKLKEYQEAPEKCTQQIEEGKAKMKVLEKRRNEEEERLSEIMSRLKEDTQDLQDEKEDYENKLVGLSQKVNEAKSKLDVSRAELDLYKEKCCAGERQLNQTKESYQATRQSISSKHSETKSCEESIADMEKALVVSRDRFSVIEEKCKTFSEKVKSSRSQMVEAQSQKSRGQLMDALMQQKTKGAIPGICGRLGDLGTIPDQYDVAISTACSALDHCVVDTMDTGIKCVEFLKKANLGTTTFIAMDKMERFRTNVTAKVKTPQNTPRLFDLVTPKDPKYSTSFYFGLRDMLVADDLDQATRIGLQGQSRHNVVTLEGHVINQSGTMTGGGTRVIKGKMSSRMQSDYTPEQVLKLKEKLETEEKAYDKFTNEGKELEAKGGSLEKQLVAARKQLKQLKIDLQVLREQEKGMVERIKQLEQQGTQTTLDPKEMAKLEKIVKENQKDYDKAAVAADEIKGVVQGLTEEIMRIGGARVQEQQKFVDKIKKDLESTSTAMNKANVAINSSARNAKKAEDKIQSLESEISNIEEKIKDLYLEITSLEDDAREAITNEKAAKSQLEDISTQIAEIKDGLKEFEEKKMAADEQMLDLKHELDRYSARVKENQTKIKHFNNEISKLCLDKEDMPEMTEEELDKINKQEMEYQITMLEERLKQMSPNMAAIEEYRKKEEALQDRIKELDSITYDRDCARKEFEDLRKRRLDEFMAGFSVITSKLKEMYQMITLGGDAELELVDSLDPFSEGIVFSVRPPKKSWKNISNLSGGEKTLSSLALVFALHHYKPSPLYVMDEIDAALDFKNVSIVAHYIKERTKNAQFIIISLRNNMFELADRLVGIYKTDNCTKSVTIDPQKIGQNVNIPQPAVC